MQHTISVTSNRKGVNNPTLASQLRRTVKTALSAEGMDLPCEINILLTDDDGIHEINREMRQVDAPTDVLSFPMFDLAPGEHPDEMDADPDTDRIPLGDMCISVERAQAQAQEYGHSFLREICYLAVHSTLHLLGYDHLDEGPMKRQMREREETIMTTLNLER
ncbi:MAG: rRNA maturation RNase YbeY [Clostridiales bacterium]|nr:rRNA maturation RNase YbeY [Candidatus Cacconaster stercorequi]